MKFNEKLTLKCEVYNRLKVKSEQGTPFLVITEQRWQTLQQKWSYVSAQTRVWQWKLDNSLPGRLGQIGDWLYRAEDRLNKPHAVDDDAQRCVNMLITQIDDHKVSSYNLFAIIYLFILFNSMFIILILSSLY